MIAWEIPKRGIVCDQFSLRHGVVVGGEEASQYMVAENPKLRRSGKEGRSDSQCLGEGDDVQHHRHDHDTSHTGTADWVTSQIGRAHALALTIENLID
jgi:hypothetical protein